MEIALSISPNEKPGKRHRLPGFIFLIRALLFTMIANLTLSSFLSAWVLNLHIRSDYNRYVIVRLFNKETRIVRSFSWYVWQGENNKVINEDGSVEDKWALLDVIDFNGSILYSAPIHRS